jgi:hypothetical protein
VRTRQQTGMARGALEMRTVLGQLIFLTGLLGYVASQGSVGIRPMVLDGHHPGVYLTYETSGPRKPRFTTESDTGIWLRLHNNMSSSIYVYGNTDSKNTNQNANGVSVLLNGVEMTACYDVESVPRLIAKNDHGTIELASPDRVKPIDDSPRESCYWALFNNSRNSGLMAVAPGNSVVFSVPQNFVTEGRRVATEFSYEWEGDERGFVREDQPHHLVYFGDSAQ